MVEVSREVKAIYEEFKFAARRVTELEARIAELEAELAALRAGNAALARQIHELLHVSPSFMRTAENGSSGWMVRDDLARALDGS